MTTGYVIGIDGNTFTESHPGRPMAAVRRANVAYVLTGKWGTPSGGSYVAFSPR